jgi:hypothetical protein
MVGSLTDLEILKLHENNALTGKIPVELISMKKLEVLLLYGNSNLQRPTAVEDVANQQVISN